jgi:hypothetical protein
MKDLLSTQLHFDGVMVLVIQLLFFKHFAIA